MRGARAALALGRWPNALIAALGVVAGAWWTLAGAAGAAGAPAPALRAVAWAAVAAMLATVVMNASNDAFDIEIDRVAHPERPLPRGELTRSAAVAIAVAALMLALVAARLAGLAALSIVAAALVVGVAYSPLLKPFGLPGNVAVATVASLPFVLGAAAAGDVSAGLPLFWVAVPLHLARELVKDVADARGDRAHRRTLAVAVGTRLTRAAAAAAVAAHVVLVTLLFAPAGWRRLALAPAVTLAVVAVAQASAARAASLLKLAMLLAMAALPFVR